jgi:DNA-directed RNA polymerase specialized sigma24 family protein
MTDRQAQFRAVVLPHMDDAMNLACWLCGNRADAEDIVQEAYLRAFKYFDRFRGGNAKPWLLAIVHLAGAKSLQSARFRCGCAPGGRSRS